MNKISDNVINFIMKARENGKIEIDRCKANQSRRENPKRKHPEILTATRHSYNFTQLLIQEMLYGIQTYKIT